MRQTIVLLSLLLVGCQEYAKSIPTNNTSHAHKYDIKTPRNQPASIQFPQNQWVKNTAGVDGRGLCVFTSMHHAGIWQDDRVFEELLVYMRKKMGGGHPQKVDNMINEFCKINNYTKPDYIQIQHNDLEILSLALKNGYMPCVTYGYSPTGRYNGSNIHHMVNIIHGDKNYFGVLDNNYIDKIEWLSPSEFLLAYTKSSGTGWAIILLSPPPPKPPVN